LCKAQLRDVNAEVEFVDPDAEVEVPAHRFLREMQIQEFPSMVLVHPNGQTMKIGFQGPFDEVVAPAIESVASSPLRIRIRERVLRCYCVVVLVEGLDEVENRRAEQSIREAFAVIERGFDAMPKAVGDLPSLLTVTAKERERERVLVWSLGIELITAIPLFHQSFCYLLFNCNKLFCLENIAFFKSYIIFYRKITAYIYIFYNDWLILSYRNQNFIRKIFYLESSIIIAYAIEIASKVVCYRRYQFNRYFFLIALPKGKPGLYFYSQNFIYFIRVYMFQSLNLYQFGRDYHLFFYITLIIIGRGKQK